MTFNSTSLKVCVLLVSPNPKFSSFHSTSAFLENCGPFFFSQVHNHADAIQRYKVKVGLPY